MLQNYAPFYQIALDLETLRHKADLLKSKASYQNEVSGPDAKSFHKILSDIQQACSDHNLTHTRDMAERISNKWPPKSYTDIFFDLNNLSDSLIYQLQQEAVLCIPPERKGFYEQDKLFGPKVADAFPSCDRDIRRAGSCYALGQEDACVHHLMLVLERGLNALAAKVGVSFHYANWQVIIDQINAKLNSTMPRGPERDFYREVTAQFGFLKEAYRKHSAHSRDDSYDMEKALHILNHARFFMQAIEEGGLAE